MKTPSAPPPPPAPTAPPPVPVVDDEEEKKRLARQRREIEAGRRGRSSLVIDPATPQNNQQGTGLSIPTN